MNTPPSVAFIEEDLDSLASVEGSVVVLADGKTLGPAGSHVDGLMGGALGRAMAAPGWKSRAKDVRTLNFPAGMAAERVILATLGEKPDREAAREAGGAIAAALAKGSVTLCTGGAQDRSLMAELIFAMALRLYEFREYKKADDENGENGKRTPREIAVTSDAPEALAAASAP